MTPSFPTATTLIEAHQEACLFLGRLWIDTDKPKRLLKIGKAHTNPGIVLYSAGALEIEEHDAFSIVFSMSELGRDVRDTVKPLIEKYMLWLLQRGDGNPPMICHSRDTFVAGLVALAAECRTDSDLNRLALTNLETIDRLDPDREHFVLCKLAERRKHAAPTNLAEIA